ncbi:bifunctional oligoribonuclease/PAP phosphatase NrnA [Patescibacteria group bacterium]
MQKQIIDLIKRKNRILIIPSSPPDGDSLGSAIALYMALRKLDKTVTVVCSDPVPEALNFLPNIKSVGSQLSSSKDFVITVDCQKTKVESVNHNIEKDKVNIIITPKDGRYSEENVSFNKGQLDFDVIITVDTAELSQLDHIYENNIEIFNQIPVINIDHHISNTHFGKINYVDIMASSTTELLLTLIEQMAEETKHDLIDEDIATLLLAGIITDTGSFQNSNTTPKAFATSAKLIAYGARQQEIIKNVYKTKQLSQLKLWGRVLSKIQVDEPNRIVWSTVSQQDFKDTGSTENETGDIIDELMTNAPGAEIVLLIKEFGDGTISGSIRTTNPTIDASKIAESFGGGGHAQAAGFRIKNGNIRDTEYKIISKIQEFQGKRLSHLKEIIEKEEEQEGPKEFID